ncbi:ABC transporter ATP-binding protein [Rhodomicrobium udaipurense JA643]|uniref:ABC transporter ATP-binding protein n=1 Tax=Rhodomicrobium udaipurense TaxID=1202716 RepID=A0A8I1GHW9_9HYPH|nr:ABC transporter ATP-binding protein [Rhodomicrobium udaipurense]KAI96405.1 ABC transporter ATP-binding protein [Rhodomicrobium udaipurense JA643]MBJ7544536.1 ABC transporter ATP-binding protein [Rhodomicrobium udaipurense]
MRAFPILEARQIVKELGQGEGKVQALKGVDLALYEGEFTLLMGPSGSGKTTLLSILGCLLTPTSGTLTLGGESVVHRSAEDLADLRRRHLGFIFQSYNLFPTLSALDNVRLGLDVRGFSSRECKERAAEALIEVGLGHRLKAYPGTLSGGEKQRVAIARAIAPEPPVILADEPTAALDTENGHAIMELLSCVARKNGRAVLAVTHDPRTIPFADRVIEIEDGIISGERKKHAATVIPARPRQPQAAHGTPAPYQERKRQAHA